MSTATSSPAAPEASTAGRTLPLTEGSLPQRILRGALTPGGAVFILLAILFIAVVSVNPSFGEPPQLIRFIGRTAPIAIAAMGQSYVIVSGEFDLSMGAVIATQVVIAGNYIGEDESRVLPAIALMLLIGVAVGVVNGLGTTILQVPSFIVTLGTMLALGGLVKYLTGGAATGNPVDTFREIGRGGIQDVPVLEVLPYPVIILVVIMVAGVWLMRSPFGRTIIATGDNPDAASLAGAHVWWVKTRAFILSVSPDAESVDRLFEFRQVLEAEAARLAAARRGDDDLVAMREAIALCDLDRDPDDWDLFGRSDSQLHLAIAHASGNPYLEVAIATAREMQRDVVSLFADHPGSMRVAIGHHQDLVDAIARGDADAAGAIMASHIAYTGAIVHTTFPEATAPVTETLSAP